MATHPMVFANTYFDDDKIVPCLLTMTSDGCLISYGIFNQQDPNSMPELRKGRLSGGFLTSSFLIFSYFFKELLLTPSPQEPIYVDVLNSNFIPLSNTQSKSSSEQHFIVLVLCKEIRLLTSNGTSKCGTDKIIGKGLGVNGTWFELKTKFWKGSTYHKAHILYFDGKKIGETGGRT